MRNIKKCLIALIMLFVGALSMITTVNVVLAQTVTGEYWLAKITASGATTKLTSGSISSISYENNEYIINTNYSVYSYDTFSNVEITTAVIDFVEYTTAADNEFIILSNNSYFYYGYSFQNTSDRDIVLQNINSWAFPFVIVDANNNIVDFKSLFPTEGGTTGGTEGGNENVGGSEGFTEVFPLIGKYVDQTDPLKFFIFDGTNVAENNNGIKCTFVSKTAEGLWVLDNDIQIQVNAGGTINVYYSEYDIYTYKLETTTEGGSTDGESGTGDVTTLNKEYYLASVNEDGSIDKYYTSSGFNSTKDTTTIFDLEYSGGKWTFKFKYESGKINTVNKYTVNLLSDSNVSFGGDGAFIFQSTINNISKFYTYDGGFYEGPQSDLNYSLQYITIDKTDKPFVLVDESGNIFTFPKLLQTFYQNSTEDTAIKRFVTIVRLSETTIKNATKVAYKFTLDGVADEIELSYYYEAVEGTNNTCIAGTNLYYLVFVLEGIDSSYKGKKLTCQAIVGDYTGNVLTLTL